MVKECYKGAPGKGGMLPYNSPVFELYKHFFASFVFLKVYRFENTVRNHTTQ